MYMNSHKFMTPLKRILLPKKGKNEKEYFQFINKLIKMYSRYGFSGLM